MTTKYLFHRIPVSLGIATLLAIPPLPAQTGRIVVTGFQTPEFLIHDTIADLYLVSNVGSGTPAAIDQRGFIS